jgi:hypothetical protein
MIKGDATCPGIALGNTIDRGLMEKAYKEQMMFQHSSNLSKTTIEIVACHCDGCRYRFDCS